MEYNSQEYKNSCILKNTTTSPYYKIGDLLKTKDDFIVEVCEIFYDYDTNKWYYSVSPIGFNAVFNREIEEGNLRKVN
jgi:hypothetical protein